MQRTTPLPTRSKIQLPAGSGRASGGACDSRYVPNVEFFQQVRDDVLRQGAHDLGGIGALDVFVDALPLGHPGAGWVGHGDEALVDGRGTEFYVVLVAGDVKVLLAVGAAVALELLVGLDPESAMESGQALACGGRERTALGSTMEQTMQARLPLRCVSEPNLSILRFECRL